MAKKMAPCDGSCGRLRAKGHVPGTAEHVKCLSRRHMNYPESQMRVVPGDGVNPAMVQWRSGMGASGKQNMPIPTRLSSEFDHLSPRDDLELINHAECFTPEEVGEDLARWSGSASKCFTLVREPDGAFAALVKEAGDTMSHTREGSMSRMNAHLICGEVTRMGANLHWVQPEMNVYFSVQRPGGFRITVLDSDGALTTAGLALHAVLEADPEWDGREQAIGMSNVDSDELDTRLESLFEEHENRERAESIKSHLQRLYGSPLSDGEAEAVLNRLRERGLLTRVFEPDHRNVVDTWMGGREILFSVAKEMRQ